MICQVIAKPYFSARQRMHSPPPLLNISNILVHTYLYYSKAVLYSSMYVLAKHCYIILCTKDKLLSPLARCKKLPQTACSPQHSNTFCACHSRMKKGSAFLCRSPLTPFACHANGDPFPVWHPALPYPAVCHAAFFLLPAPVRVWLCPG